MATLPGPGPVFEFEWLTGSRRWQLYATRSLFVGGLLAALGVVWWTTPYRDWSVNQGQSRLASNVYLAIVGTQLAVVLLVAPAATAGAVCVDRARGTLEHVLVTDLTDAEVVLGKLAARLVPVLATVACTLPVAYLCTLMGGIDPDDLAGAYAVTAGVAVLGGSLAMALSVRAGKTHEVLLATYMVWVLWLLAWPIARQFEVLLEGVIQVPAWLNGTDPFTVAFAAHGPRGRAGAPTAGFVVGCLLASTALLASAVRDVRRVAARESGRTSARPKAGRAWAGKVGAARGWVAGRLPGPSLDGNPVLWREWHRGRPSRWSRRVWGLYAAGSVAFTVIAAARDGGPWAWPRLGGMTSVWVNGFQVAIGTLLLSAGASTALAEERARGALDVLLCTPLSTPSVVWGKWLGTFRRAPWLAALPTGLAAYLAWSSGRWAEVPLLAALVLAYGAFFTSLGLALATWVPRPGRAAAVCVTADVLLTAGWFFLVLMVSSGPEGERRLGISPFGGPAILTAEVAGVGPSRFATPRLSLGAWEFIVAYRWDFFALGFYASGAAGLLVATFLSFDRCLGRAPAPYRPEPAPHVFPDVVQFSSPEPRKSGPGHQSLTTDGRLR